jgi:hypothetical protein
MLYAVKKDGLYLASNGQYVSQSGQIGDGTKPVAWVKGALNGLGTSSKDHAQAMADIYGGEVCAVQI